LNPSILLCCLATPATTLQRIKADSNALPLTAAGCLIERLNALDITRVGFASPYVGEINRLATDLQKPPDHDC